MRVWPRGGLWRHPDFLRLWSAQTVSQFGSQVSQLALPLWRPLAVTVALSNFFNTLAFSIFLVYAVRQLDLSAALIGLVLGVGNVGWLLGAVAANRLSARLGVGLTLVGSAMVFGPALLLVPAAPQSQPIPFIVVA
ncbi:MAG: hypothetical protein H0W31_10370, partial [Actinobacteria bacterium]|nr:hypothetical protein [Actinomycetota bacterium]